jgi:hypothetical protein
MFAQVEGELPTASPSYLDAAPGVFDIYRYAP